MSNDSRKTLINKKRRIIMNNDGDDYKFCREGPKNAETFLKQRTTALANSQVDAVFYCTGGSFNFYSHHSEVSEIRKVDGFNKPDWLWELKEIEGRDTLEIISDFCHDHNMEVFWSMRMNDVHDYAYPPFMSQWKRQHNECLLGFSEVAPSALNYEAEPVRMKVLDIIRDVCTRYDIEGIELDFLRNPIFFRTSSKGKVSQHQCDIMTSLLKQIRSLVDEISDKRRKPILIAARLPDSVPYAKGVGLDIVEWLEHDLLDMMIGGGFFHLEPWENFAALGKKYEISTSACLSTSRLVDPAYPSESKIDLEQLRGEALRAWEAGIDSIYTFNFFDPESPIFREIGDPELLKTLPHKYQFLPGNGINSWLPEGDKFIIPDLKAY